MTILKFTAVGLLSFILFACYRDDVHSVQQRLPQTTFNVVQLDAIYKNTPVSERLSFLIAVVGKYGQEAKGLDSFLITKHPDILKRFSQYKLVELVRYQELLFHQDLDKASFEFESAIAGFNHRLPKAWSRRLEPIMLIAFIQRCAARNELKLLANYNQRLGKVLKPSLPSWIRIEYYSKKAFLAVKRGDLFRALLAYHKALSQTHKSDKKNLSYLYHEMANLYMSIESYQKANFYAELSVRQVGIDNYAPLQLNMIGMVQSKAGKFSAAEKTFLKALKTAERKDMPILKAQTLANFGNLRRKQKRFKEALSYLNQSDSLCEILGIPIGKMFNAINRAELYYDQKEFQKADAELEDYEKMVNRIDEPKQNYNYYELYARVKDSLGQVHQANAYFKRSILQKQRYFGDAPQALVIGWELNQVKINKTQQETQFQLKVQKQQIANYLLLFSLLTIVFAFGLIHIYTKRKRQRQKQRALLKKQQMSHQLELKSRELLAESLKNHSIQEVKNEIKKKLEFLAEKMTQKDKQILDALIRELGSKVSSQFFEEFEHRFAAVHESFYVKLKEIAPTLTPHELRICALIRLNITSKEMALITNRTVGTIDNTRSLIRKKMNLAEHINLQEFILSL